MTKTQIFSYVLIIPILFLAWRLYKGIEGPIREKQRIEAVEAQVINKLKTLRNVQLGFYSVNGKYAGSKQEIIDFINNGKFLNIQRKETVDSINAQGVETVRVQIDTLGTTPVQDSLFPAANYPNFSVERLFTIPGSNQEFTIYAGKINRPNLPPVDVFEISDPAPVNPERRRNDNKNALRVGSREEATTAGNWESL